MNKTELKALKGRITSAINADEKTDASIHALATEVLAHAADSGDFTLFARLIGDVTTAGGEVFGRGVRSRRLALLEWAGEFSPLRVNGDGVIGALKSSAKGYVAYNLSGAKANPFWTLQSEANRRVTNRPFDLTTISGRLSGIGKAIDKQVEAGTLTPEDEQIMRDLSVKLNATFAKFVRDNHIDLDAVKAQRDALVAEQATVADDEGVPCGVNTDETPNTDEQAAANLGGTVVEEAVA